MTKILTVIGARPQFIKASVVSAAIRQTPALKEVVVHTGQHHDPNMSDVFFAELGMRPPDHHLGIHGGKHGEMTGRMLAALEDVLIDHTPDVVMVYGDTNSTLAGALAAAKLHIPVAHVEAGLRSFNMRMPEEINRILTDRISNLLFAPSNVAHHNLLREGANPQSIIVTGDVMYDVALQHGARADARELRDRLGVAAKDYVLVTIHRAENTDDVETLSVILQGLADVARARPVIWPIHPRTRRVLAQDGSLARWAASLKIIDPIGYMDMVGLERHAAVIATDSGGVQKEAFYHGVPCVTVRHETEWVELVDAGWNTLVPPVAAGEIARAILAACGTVGQPVKPYGEGDAAVKIANTLAASFST